MTGISGVKIKIMPDSPNADIESIKSKAKEIIESSEGKSNDYTEEPIAFGLKAVIAFFQWSEEKPLEDLEKKLQEIENVQSTQVIDMRKIA